MNEPDYLKNATPVPQNQRAAWFKNIAPAYAGIILWFVFWQDIVKIYPEYESVKALADKQQVPFIQVFAAAMSAAAEH